MQDDNITIGTLKISGSGGIAAFVSGARLGNGNDVLEVGNIQFKGGSASAAYFGGVYDGWMGNDILRIGHVVLDFENSINSAAFDSLVFGEEGDDEIRVGDVEFRGGSGSTAYFGGSCLGGSGNDSVKIGNAVLDFENSISSAAFTSGVAGEAGNDTIKIGDLTFKGGIESTAYFGGGDDGGAGNDSLTIGNIDVKGTNDADAVFLDRYAGGDGDDKIDAGGYKVDGRGGDDFVVGPVVAGDNYTPFNDADIGNGTFDGSGNDKANMRTVFLTGGNGNDTLVSAEIGGVEALKGGESILKGEDGDDIMYCLQGSKTSIHGGTGVDEAHGACVKITGVP